MDIYILYVCVNLNLYIDWSWLILHDYSNKMNKMITIIKMNEELLLTLIDPHWPSLWYDEYWIIIIGIKYNISMDWFKGKSTGNHYYMKVGLGSNNMNTVWLL